MNNYIPQIYVFMWLLFKSMQVKLMQIQLSVNEGPANFIVNIFYYVYIIVCMDVICLKCMDLFFNRKFLWEL